MFSGFVSLHELCERCHVRFERQPGSWTIATWLSISAGVAISSLLTVRAWTQGWMVPGWEWGVGAISLIFSVLVYRPIKGASFGLLHAVGLMVVDPVQVGNVVYLDRFRQQRAPSAPQARQGG